MATRSAHVVSPTTSTPWADATGERSRDIHVGIGHAVLNPAAFGRPVIYHQSLVGSDDQVQYPEHHTGSEEDTDFWRPATSDETLAAVDAAVVVPTTDAGEVVDFADATPSSPTGRGIVSGGNFVASRSNGPAEGAFSPETVAATTV